MQDDAEKVSRAWGEVYTNHPEAYRIRRPHQIGRLAHNDFHRLLTSLGLPQPATTLEAGCGSGRDSLFLASRGHRVTALDVHSEPLAHLADAVEAYNAHHEVIEIDRVQADIFAAPFPDAHFDLVFSSGVVEHYPEPATRQALLAEMARLTKPGGHVVVAIPNHAHTLEPVWAWLIHRFTDHDDYDMPEQPISVDALSREIAAVGLEPVTAECIDAWDTLGRYPSFAPCRAASSLATRFLPQPPVAVRRHWGTRIIVVARAS